MFTIPEQLSAASKASVDAQFTLMATLTSKTFEGFGKIVDLNLNAARTSLDETRVATKRLLAAKDAQEWLTLAAANAQPTVEKSVAYGRHLASIASDLQTELAKATEAQVTEASRKALELIEELTQNAPAGSENAVALLKSAIGNANATYEQLAKTTKQAAETLEANLNTAVNQFTDAAKAAPRAAKK